MMSFSLKKFICVVIVVIATAEFAHGWKYQTSCTVSSKSQKQQQQLQTQPLSYLPRSYIIDENNNGNNDDSDSIVNDFEREQAIVESYDDINGNPTPTTTTNKMMHLKCSNENDFLFIGLTQYGVHSNNQQQNQNQQCQISQDDCLVRVDYLANQCNGLNACDIQLDAQFLHTCKNHSDYLFVAYECIPGAKRLDICSNDELYIIDPTTRSSSSSNDIVDRFGSLYLTSPNYPMEYADNLNNCSCQISYVHIDEGENTEEEEKKETMNLQFKTFEFDMEEGGQDFLHIQHNEQKPMKLGGRHKEFSEFYSRGVSFKLNLTTDDVISRRGFLIRIAPTRQTRCPVGTRRLTNSKCVQIVDDEKLSWSQASRSCLNRGGRLLAVNDFVDNAKLSDLLEESNENVEEDSFWSTITSYSSSSSLRSSRRQGGSSSNKNYLNIRSGASNKCLTRHFRLANYWQHEKSCQEKKAFICEFAAQTVVSTKPRSTRSRTVNQNQNKKNRKNNKLIRVACGSASTLFSSSFKREQQHRQQPTTTVKQAVKSNSIWNTQRPTIAPQQQQQQQNQQQQSFSNFFPRSTFKKTDTTTATLTSVSTTSTSTETPKAAKSVVGEDPEEVEESIKRMFSDQDLALIVAVVTGLAVVLIAINVFCIWQYYDRKLRKVKKENATYIQRDAVQRASTRRERGSGGDGSLSSTTTSGGSSSDTTSRTIHSNLTGDLSYANKKQYCDSDVQAQLLQQYYQQQQMQQFQQQQQQPLMQHHLYETLQRAMAAAATQNQQQQNIYLNPSQHSTATNEYHCIGNEPQQQQIQPIRFEALSTFQQQQILDSFQQQQQPQKDLKQQQSSIVINSDQQKQQQHYATIYSDMSPSSSTTSSNQPLLTFVNNKTNGQQQQIAEEDVSVKAEESKE